jgi:antitoxin CcdA
MTNTAVAKKATNLSIRADLLAEARAHKINLSATLESALSEILRASRQAAWRDENREAITAYERHLERDGLFADRVRLF